MLKLAKKLSATTLFGLIPIEQLVAILENSPQLEAAKGDIIIKAEEQLHDHLVLLEGQLEIQRIWSTTDSYDKSHTWILKPDEKNNHPGILSAACKRLRVRALSDIRYLFINADIIDELLGWKQQFGEAIKNNPQLEQQMNLVRQVSIFHFLPLENIQQAFERMTLLELNAGDTVIKEGDPGDAYYLIKQGEAEVIRSDPMTGETAIVDHIAAGDSFGEEALLQRGYRNATIRMLTPAQLWVLTRADFDTLVRPAILSEITANKAKPLIDKGKVRLLDCRYDIEFEENRIPSAELLPLHLLRFETNKLDPAMQYIVYCRSGRRSKAAAFLLRERNFDVQSLIGGIKDWPYEIESDLL